jgi:hypothetical protein
MDEVCLVTNIQNKTEISMDVTAYTMRPATWEDAEGVTAMLNAWSTHYLGVSQFQTTDQIRDWQTPGFNLEDSTCVAVAPDRQIVAYYEIWDQDRPPVRVNLWGRAHPEHEGRSLGSHLMSGVSIPLSGHWLWCRPRAR